MSPRRSSVRGRIAGLLVVLVAGGAALSGWRFDADLDAARARIGQGSRVIDTSCGPIEVQEAGEGVPLLAVHGSGGGFDQGMASAAPLENRGICVIAMSRFGYLRTTVTPSRMPQTQMPQPFLA